MKKIIIAFALMFVSGYSFAGFGCKGVPKVVAVWNHSGMLGVKLEGHNKMWLICDVDQDSGCDATFSLILAAKAKESVVQINFTDSIYPSCSETPQWKDISSSFDHISELD